MWVSRQPDAVFLFLILPIFWLVTHVHARETKYIYGTDAAGKTRQLAVDRTPGLYTGDFGDCLGGQSLLNITKFDAAYYADNLTIVFHLDGTTNIDNESLMMHISVDAYGSSRFSMTFDPCFLNVYSLCPLNASVPINAWALIPLGMQHVESIPLIALNIPDFEGSAKLQIFANSSETEIGCFQAVMRNGASFSHPEVVAPVLGIFTTVAILASFLTAVYGVSITHMRTHYAHSLSVLVVFDAFQTVFFSGALTVNWPSVLVAWWSNFAWSAGLIYSPRLVRSLDWFAGISGNASQVGGAGSVVINNGGGLISQIYGQSLTRPFSAIIAKRAEYNESNPYDYTWSGDPVTPGMPTPGTWVGLPGTLSGVYIPAADAFLVGLIWFLVALGLVIFSIIIFKFTLEACAKLKYIEQNRLAYFRSHWTAYLCLAVLRALFIGFFMITTLALYQFNLRGPAGATAISVIVFGIFLIGITGLATYACRSRLRFGRFTAESDKVVLHHDRVLKGLPCILPVRESTLKERELDVKPLGTLPWLRIRHIDDDPTRPTVHQDQPYVKSFGWLSARYRRTRWWFFTYYLGYQLVRACFLGGAARSPLAQVYGLFLVEIIAFVIAVHLKPFEGARNTALAVWMLGITKILTTGLSIAFLPAFDLDRIIATVLGVIIIVIQGLLVFALLILIILGAISSWMSLTRNREEFPVKSWEGIRVRYFENLEEKAADAPHPRKSKPKEHKKKGNGKAEDADNPLEEPKEPYFEVTAVRRAPKIEDEDGDVVADMEAPHNGSTVEPPYICSITRASRTNSVSSHHSVGSLPRGARPHRTSWSARDFTQWEVQQMERPDSGLAQQRLSGGSSSAATGSALVANGSSCVSPLTEQLDSSHNSSRLVTPTGTRPSSPLSTLSPLSSIHPGTPTRDTLRKYADERKFTNTQPSKSNLRHSETNKRGLGGRQ